METNIETEAARQLRQLDLEGQLKNGSSSKSKNGRSSSVTRQPISTRVVSPRSPTGSTNSDGTSDVPKKLPMNRITVGNAPSPEIQKVTSKIGSLSNTSYKPSGGKIKIESKKLEWTAKSKIGSMSNVKHVAGGGAVKIESKKVEIKSKSRVGSLGNVGYQPGGGEKKIFDDKEYLKRAKSSTGQQDGGQGHEVKERSRRSSSSGRV